MMDSMQIKFEIETENHNDKYLKKKLHELEELENVFRDIVKDSENAKCLQIRKKLNKWMYESEIYPDEI